MRRAPFSTLVPLDSDAMDTANAHNDTIDGASDLLEHAPTADDETSGPLALKGARRTSALALGENVQLKPLENCSRLCL